jgi:hypothetical protein
MRLTYLRLGRKGGLGKATGGLSGWWRKGETPNSFVYRQSMAVLGLTPIAAAIVLFCVVSRFDTRVVAVVLSILTVDCILTSHRAVILNDRDLVYRPPVGGLLTIPLSSIA